MYVSMRWLARHVDLTDITPEQLANDLTLSTAEVEGVERFAPQLHDVVVGHVTARVPHPDAEKLYVELQEKRPRFAWMSPPCGPESSVQNLNQRTPEQRQNLEQKLKRVKKIQRNVRWLYAQLAQTDWCIPVLEQSKGVGMHQERLRSKACHGFRPTARPR